MKAEHIIITLTVLLLFSVGINVFQHFGTMKGELLIERNNEEINRLKKLKEEIEVYSEEEINNIDKNLKREQYFKDNIKEQTNEKINNYYNKSDSLQFYDWARSAKQYRDSESNK
jgi:hypothetical protein